MTSFVAEDGERVTVVTFEDRASHERWATDAVHRDAQRLGRDGGLLGVLHPGRRLHAHLELRPGRHSARRPSGHRRARSGPAPCGEPLVGREVRRDDDAGLVARRRRAGGVGQPCAQRGVAGALDRRARAGPRRRGGTSSPVTPSTTVSAVPVHDVATTATPAAIASSTTVGWPSHTEARATTSALARIARASSSHSGDDDAAGEPLARDRVAHLALERAATDEDGVGHARVRERADEGDRVLLRREPRGGDDEQVARIEAEPLGESGPADRRRASGGRRCRGPGSRRRPRPARGADPRRRHATADPREPHQRGGAPRASGVEAVARDERATSVGRGEERREPQAVAVHDVGGHAAGDGAQRAGRSAAADPAVSAGRRTTSTSPTSRSPGPDGDGDLAARWLTRPRASSDDLDLHPARPAVRDDEEHAGRCRHALIVARTDARAGRAACVALRP